MSKTLVIVESPGKISKISQYLGDNYIVKASYGHVQDLDKSTLSIDVENNFKPLYKVSTDKLKVVKELRSISEDCKEVILASDGDREGEAIAYSLASVLKLHNPKRIIFNEITKQAITKAILNPTIINENMVNAQQTRRLLDRLVGYKISPVLWKHISSNGNTQSAGRVQSVVVKILVDKETEISKSISEGYYKTSGEFILNNKTKINSILCNENKQYNFECEEEVIKFLGLINKKTTYKIISVDNKKGQRKPSPPFITSSLQQEASTKLHFNVKKTMDVAQKLYEAGLITYMRSDCPNISKDAIDEIKSYIIKEYGKEYSDPKNYESKNSSSQDAHECIRPTHIENKDPDKLDKDQMRLYTLIWKRTIASQMSNAEVNIQTIKIDCINTKSILLIKEIQCYFVSILENTEFAGYLIVYDNSEEDSEKNTGKIEVKTKDKLDLELIKVSEEYTKPPLRFNEALLVKYLEKNGIGRPSTYASIISKVIDRKYVEVRDIEGIKKKSRIFETDKSFKICEKEKEVIIGKEQKKLVPTEIGQTVNEFMIKHFEPIMDIEYTANFETYLDKIAIGKANWVTILKTFYEQFNPIVEKLNKEAKKYEQKAGKSTDKLLGEKDGQEYYIGEGKYGPYVKVKENDKWRYASIKDYSPDNITLEEAQDLLEYPKEIGKIKNAIVTLNKGQYGYYLKCSNKNIPLKNKDPKEVTIEYARELYESGDPYALKTFKIKNKTVNVKNGEYGPYLQLSSGLTKQFIKIPNMYKIEKLTIEDVLKIIALKNGTKKQKDIDV